MLELLCKNRRCIVVGSAPGATLPDPEPYDVVIGANGGAAVARNAGLPSDLLVTTSHLFRPRATAAEQLTVRALQDMDLCVQSTWVDTKNGAPPDFRRWGISPGWVRPVDPTTRSQIVEQACGLDVWVSTGIFAACLAVASGASEVILAGISLSAGHAGMADDAPRHHVDADTMCLYGLLDHPVQLPAELRRALA